MTGNLYPENPPLWRMAITGQAQTPPPKSSQMPAKTIILAPITYPNRAHSPPPHAPMPYSNERK